MPNDVWKFSQPDTDLHVGFSGCTVIIRACHYAWLLLQRHHYHTTSTQGRIQKILKGGGLPAKKISGGAHHPNFPYLSKERSQEEDGKDAGERSKPRKFGVFVRKTVPK